ncbi:NAD-dependent epimerase/dehydratase family protein [Paenibacillus psychroresistens]|uniref:NAD-dependent epimerase/dehydratase family protein n=1 Tax=Paenibacillus psychroresistens TaxID=1778678 RepID=A0A6B8RUP2_9BACL|nr:NAD-dependent epimerase/dehydratase family protein [Paenibacillus psychroresistens]QGQ99647.1 NAD-dependent epimerase/dehydratase family protein [Paenibacillus psychroresistens]
MNALVTGATGFLGKSLALNLQQLGWNVTATGRNPAIGSELLSQNIRFVPVDLRDPIKTNLLCADQDVVYHCAALSTPWGKYADFYSSNVQATEHIVQGCMAHNVGRLVHVSTPSVYLDYTHRLNIKESAPLPFKFANAYAATKRLAELVVKKAASAGLAAIILRPRAIIGPGDPSIFPRLIKANSSRGIPLIDGGSIELDLTYIDNVVEALVLCGTANASASGEIYNITNQEPVTFIQVLHQLFDLLELPLKTKPVSFANAYRLAYGMELLAKVLPGNKEPLLTRYTVGVLGRSQTLDITKAVTNLGYKPKVSLTEGLGRFAAAWRAKL